MTDLRTFRFEVTVPVEVTLDASKFDPDFRWSFNQYVLGIGETVEAHAALLAEWYAIGWLKDSDHEHFTFHYDCAPEDKGISGEVDPEGKIVVKAVQLEAPQPAQG